MPDTPAVVPRDGPVPSHPPRFVAAMLASLLALLLGFAAWTLFSTLTSRQIHAIGVSIAENAAPSIVAIDAATRALGQLQGAVLTVRTRDDAQAAAEDIRDAQRELRVAIDAYAGLPAFVGEHALRTDLRQKLARVDATIARLLQSRRLDELGPELSHAINRLEETISTIARFNVAQTESLVAELEAARTRSLHLAILLNAFGVLVALLAAWVAILSMRRYARETRQTRDRLERRSAELEQFAGRIAHDILSPLATASLAFDFVGREDRLPSASPAQAMVLRGGASLARVKRLVDGLLEFARAGGRPLLGARAPLCPIVEDVVGEFRPLATEADVTLEVAPLPACELACSVGVLTSILSNLLQNAIKYAASCEVRRVEVRASCNGRAHVEVEDTGPGVPPELRGAIFEPLIRGNPKRVPGIGLGLATVQRMVISHGGTVGLRSEVGKGSVFWFELPLAGKPSGAGAGAAHP